MKAAKTAYQATVDLEAGKSMNSVTRWATGNGRTTPKLMIMPLLSV